MHGCIVRVVSQTSVPNEVRRAATHAALVEATLESLVDVGYVRTTGVEVCRRAGVTRGALQYHFPDFGQLLASALGVAYDRLLVPAPVPPGVGPLERWVHQVRARVGAPEFKAILELWLGAQNDPDLGEVLAGAIAHGSILFTPSMVLSAEDTGTDPSTDRIYRTINEAFIGLGVGIATNGGRALGHHDAVVDTLLELARTTDQARHGHRGTKGDTP